MRVAVVSHIRHPIRAPFMGGMEAHSWHLARGLRARGHDVTLFASGDSDPDLSLEIMCLFERLNDVGVTVLVASHDLALLQRLIALRKERVALRRGTTRILLSHPHHNLYAHGRGEGDGAGPGVGGAGEGAEGAGAASRVNQDGVIRSCMADAIVSPSS